MNNINALFSTSGVTDSNRMLHTPGLFAKNNILYVQEVGKLKSITPHQSKREKLDSFLFLSILSGEGTVTVENKKYIVKKGDCGFINCKSKYMHESSELNPWELSWVHFNGNIACSYYEFFEEKNAGEAFFRPKNMKEVQNTINKLMLCQKEKDLESELVSGELLLHLINYCIITVMNNGKENFEHNKSICKEIREYVNVNYSSEDLIPFLADKYIFEEKELDALFQKIYGITLRDYILNRRFTFAKELLRFTIKPINEIVEESGIRNEDLFIKLFQDGEGMSAEDYRMKWSQWIK